MLTDPMSGNRAAGHAFSHVPKIPSPPILQMAAGLLDSPVSLTPVTPWRSKAGLFGFAPNPLANVTLQEYNDLVVRTQPRRADA